MHIVTRTGFGRTILCTIVIISIEHTNHICWVLQMCLRHGIDLKCAIFTDQGLMLAAAALFNKKFQILLKLQLCLQHIVCCICWLHPALFRTRKDNNRSPPVSGKNKYKAVKIKGKQNGQILHNMVHLASYATTCSKFFRCIANSVRKLVVQNPGIITNVMDVGI